MDTTSVALGSEPSRRRRSFTVEFKRRLVAQCLEPGASVAKIAREHDLNANQVFKWCRRFGLELALPTGPMLPVTVIDEQRESAPPDPCDGVIEIEVANARVRVTGAIDVSALRVVIEALRAR